MREELDNALCEKYPKIFAQRHDSPNTTCMCYGFPGNGWYDILDNLCGAIQDYCDNVKKYDAETKQLVPACKQVVAVQVKEKFGELRFYFEGGNSEIHGMVTMATYMSRHTCEECGKPGELRPGGWVRTLCDKHAKRKHIRS